MKENLPINVILADDKIQFKKEQDDLLKTVLDYRFFHPWKNLTAQHNNYGLQVDSNLEIYITNKCNQNCSYCYLQKYPQLYPENVNEETILHNLSMLYDYLIINHFYIPEIDMFSGEIWHTSLGLKILSLTYDYTQRGLSFGHIMITSNCFFVNNYEKLHSIQHFIDEFNAIGQPIIFSISVDGKYIDNEGRPRNDGTEYTDDYYDNLFTFARHNNYTFHPMVSAANIKYWPENYKWWKKMHEYYKLNLYQMMLLEVRNDDWTDETIKQYCDFLTIQADDFLDTICKGDIKIMANALSDMRMRNQEPLINGYVPWALTFTDTFSGCTVATHLTVRLGDLAICPCHRLAYDKYLYGKFVVENDMIVDIKAINPQMAIKILMGNILVANPKCDTCLFKSCCLKGCHGSQLESVKDPFFPIPSVCKLYKEKYSHILQYYKAKGLIDYYKSFSAQELGSNRLLFILQLYEAWEAYNNEMGTDR